MSSWAAALRIARRDAWRAKGRSVLVVAMIALPVLGVSAVDVIARTVQLSPEQQAAREFGAADALLTDGGATVIDQYGGSVGGAARAPGAAVDLAAGLPAGSRWVPDRTVRDRVTAGDRATSVDVRDLAYDDPLVAGLYRQVTGRPATAPGEVVLTTALAERLAVGVGGAVAVGAAGRESRVVGTVAGGSRYDELTALVRPASLPAVAGSATQLFVDVPGTLDVSVVRAANAHGVAVRARTEPVPGAPPSSTGQAPTAARDLATATLVAGMALLEVVLLAGPAFAVGARRSRHQLALLAVTGAERRDVRRTVLAGGIVLGGVGGALGLLAGVGLALAALPLGARTGGDVPGPLDLRPLELAGIALLGVVTALLAALLPARTAARQDVVAALTGRRGTVRTSARTPVLGLVTAAAGGLLALEGARRRDVLLVLAGSAVAELGLVATTPAVVGLVGRLGPLLPAAPRLALRDAARSRGRTAPAVAAVLAAVAGATAVGTYVASLQQYQARQYTASALPGTAVLSTYDPAERRFLPAAAQALRTALPAQRVLPVDELASSGGTVELLVPPGRRCPLHALGAPADPAAVAAARSDPRCSPPPSYRVSQLSGDLVGGADLLRWVAGTTDPALLRVLAAGGVVVPRPELLDEHGRATVLVHPAGAADGTVGRRLVLPGAALPPDATATTVFSPAAAARTGVATSPVGLVAVLDRPVSVAEQDTAQGALTRVGIDTHLYVERGPTGSYGLVLLALLVASAVLVLGASGIATGLAAAEGRADLATLAAVGATPGLRRRLAGCRSYVTAGLGTVLGLAAGLVPAVGLIRALNATTGHAEPAARYPTVLPWANLLVTLLVVPLVAALAAALLTRSRLPLVRRLA